MVEGTLKLALELARLVALLDDQGRDSSPAREALEIVVVEIKALDTSITHC